MLPPSTAEFRAGSRVSGFGPICTDKIFLSLDVLVALAVLPDVESAVLVDVLLLEEHPATLAAMTAAMSNERERVFISVSPFLFSVVVDPDQDSSKTRNAGQRVDF